MRRQEKSFVRLSKFLSLVLRHDPSRIGLALDNAGWADVDELMRKVNAAGVPLTRERLTQVVAQNDKQRFAFSSDGERIRASYGHSIPVSLDLASVAPPVALYHGTAARFLGSIQRQGLTARRRNYVHLSSDTETARAVGRRHGEPVILTVRAQAMAKDGYLFYRSASGIWLTERVPVVYLVFPASLDAS